ncbi:MAG: hypothetical protein ACU0BS_03765 [Hasllibacter sp.]
MPEGLDAFGGMDALRGLSPLGAAGAPSPPPPPPPAAVTAQRRMAEDRVWSWPLEPRALRDPVRGRVYSGAVRMADGAQTLEEWDAATGEHLASHVVGTGLAPDDHNAPQAIIDGAGRLAIAYAPHNDAGSIRTRRSTDTDPANLGPEDSRTVGGNASYALLHVGPWGISALTRVSNGVWNITRDAGGDVTALGSAATFLDGAGQPYVSGVAVGDRIWLLSYAHATKSSGGAERGRIRVLSLDPADPAPGGVPHAHEGLPLLYDPAAKPPLSGGTWKSAHNTARVLSVNDDFTAFAFATFQTTGDDASVGDTHGDQRYYLARMTGTDRADPAHWTFEDLGAATHGSFWRPSHYVAGVELIGRGAEVTGLWLAREDAVTRRSFLEHWARADAASAWTRTPIMDGPRVLARPSQPRGAAPFALVQELAGYVKFDRPMAARAHAVPGPQAVDLTEVAEAAPFVATEAAAAIRSPGTAWTAPLDLIRRAARPGDVIALIGQFAFDKGGDEAIPSLTTAGLAWARRATHASTRMRSVLWTATVGAEGVAGDAALAAGGDAWLFQSVSAALMRGVGEVPAATWTQGGGATRSVATQPGDALLLGAASFSGSPCTHALQDHAAMRPLVRSALGNSGRRSGAFGVAAGTTTAAGVDLSASSSLKGHVLGGVWR